MVSPEVDRQLRLVLQEIEPSSAQIEGAKRSHTYLREQLEASKLAVADSYLSGSYARDTAISPLDDVDVVFVIDPKGWEIPFFSLSSLPSPKAVLASFNKAIRYRYNSSLRTQGHSVRLQMNHLNIDVVPAVIAREDARFIKIPDIKRDEWILTAPRAHSDISTKINKQRGGLLKPLVKLLKKWNSELPSTACLKSFAIETWLVRMLSSLSPEGLTEGLRYYFDFCAHLFNEECRYKWRDSFGIEMSWLAREIQDVAGTGSNVVANVDVGRRERFLSHAVAAQRRLEKAIEGKTWLDRAEAVEAIFQVSVKNKR